MESVRRGGVAALLLALGVAVTPLRTWAQVVAPPGNPAQEAYDQEYIGFDDVAVVVVQDGIAAPPVPISTPYEGKYKRPLLGEDFYRKLGRLDLVEAYESKERLKTGLTIGGGLAIVAGLVVGIATAPHGQGCGAPGSPGLAACVEGGQPGLNGPAIGLSIGLTLLGGALLGAGVAIDPNPVTPSQARQLADQYNQALQQGFTAPPPEPLGSEVQFRIEPRLFADGAGLLLGGRF